MQDAARISRLAIVAMVFGIFGPLCGLAVSFIISFVQFGLALNFFPFSLSPFDSLAIGYLISWLPAYLIGKKALCKIAVSNGSLRGIGFAKFSIKAAIVWAVLLPASLCLSMLWGGIYREIVISHRMTCGKHLAEFGGALKIYAEEHGEYPTADKWCDILLQGGYVTEEIFKCPGDKKARCSYSINPNCEPNSPPDVVLLFESKGGWNSYGGLELFTVEHHTNDGGNILYNDGHVSFNYPVSNGRFFEELNWGEKDRRLSR